MIFSILRITLIAATLVFLAASSVLSSSVAVQNDTAPLKTHKSSPLRFHAEDENIVLLRTYLGSIFLSEGMLGIADNEKIFVSLQEFIAALQFPISVKPKSGQAHGWFIREQKTFLLDSLSMTAVIEEKTIPFQDDQFLWYEDGIFIDTNLLQKWFPLEITYTALNQQMDIESLASLPIEDRIYREKKLTKKQSSESTDTNKEEDIALEAEYSILSMQALDLTYSSSFDRSSKLRSDSIGLTATGDILALESRLSLSATEKEITNFSALFSRTDIQRRLFNIPGATKIEIGDIYTFSIPLVTSSKGGRGFTFSGFPLNYKNEAGLHTFTGTTNPNWDIELYHNKILIETQRTRDDGHYEFSIPMHLGNNTIKLIFYGSFGEIREESYQIYQHQDIIPKGDFYYKFAFSQNGKPLIPITKAKTSQNNKTSKNQYSATIEYGLSASQSIRASVTKTPAASESGKDRYYAVLGTNMTFFGIYNNINFSKAFTSGGSAIQVETLAFPLETNVSINYIRYFNGFMRANAYLSSSPLQETLSFRLSRRLTIFPKLPIALRLSGKREDFLNYSSYTAKQRTSATLFRTRISNSISYRKSHNNIGTFNGNIIFNKKILGNINVRGTVQYALYPESYLKEISLSSHYNINNSLRIHGSITHPFAQNSQTNYSLGLYKSGKKTFFGVQTDYVSNDNFTVGINISTSMMYDPSRKSVIITSNNTTATGSILCRAFFDKNNDGIFNSTDMPLSDIRINIKNHLENDETDENGYLFLRGISPHRKILLSIDISSLNDPYWVPKHRSLTVIVRPGRSITANFPIILLGEISGFVYLKQAQKQEENSKHDSALLPVSDVMLEIVNDKNTVIKTVRTEYDGFYIFNKIPLGEYSLRVSPAQAKRSSLQTKKDKKISITLNSNSIFQNMILEKTQDFHRN